MAANQKIELEGRGVLVLKPADHVATGGEGSVYRPSSDTIIKIYTDPKKMVSEGIPEKIKLLKRIVHPFIVAPKGLVLSGAVPIGYYMNYEDGEALARVFTTSYQTRENFTNDDVLSLVNGMRTVVETAHTNKAVLVDANELNWLVSRKGKTAEPRIIDVDSWAIDRWKPSVIMPSIRDWHTVGFNDSSDWFSYAVVSFQVFTGIHPYKGTLQGFKPNDMEERMKNKKSVFTPGVRLNNAVRDFNLIPPPLLAWYESVFQGNERSVPPTPYDKALKTPKAAIVHRMSAAGATGLLIMDVLYDGVSDRPVYVYPCGVVRLNSGRLVNLANKAIFDRKFNQSVEVVATDNGFLVGEVGLGGALSFLLVDKNGASTPLETSMQGSSIIRYQNRMFILGLQGITEITVKILAKPLLVNKNTWQTVNNSTRWFNGVGVQDTMGAMFIITPFDEASCQYTRIPELDRKKVIDAVSGTRYVVLSVLDAKKGAYQKYELVFSKDYSTYQLTITDIATPDINSALLPKGVVAAVVSDGNLLITVPINGAQTQVSDTAIDTSFTLFNWENRVVGIQGSKVWSISIK